MEETRELLTIEQAINLLPEGMKVHTFRNTFGTLIGANWGRELLLKAIANAEWREVGGERCRKMGHGLVLKDDKGFLFIETKKL